MSCIFYMIQDYSRQSRLFFWSFSRSSMDNRRNWPLSRVRI